MEAIKVSEENRLEAIAMKRKATRGDLLTKLIHQEWERVLQELQALDIDSGDLHIAARLIGQYQILDKLMAALSEGNLGSDYEIEADWREKLIAYVVEGFDLDKPASPPRPYKSLAQQLAEECGLEVIQA
jgi:hypothetical protein